MFQGTRYLFSGSNAGLPGVPESLQRINGYANVLTNFEITRDRQERRSLQVDASTQISWRGRHSLKAGVVMDRIGIDSLLGETGNSVVLRWNQALAGARGTYGHYEVNSNHSLPDRGSIERADAVSNNLALFLQDSWAIGSRLTLDLGVRAENERIPSFSPDPAIPATAIHFSLRDKIAPRVGLASRSDRRGHHQGLRQLGPVLRHHQTGAAGVVLRGESIDALLLHPRQRRLAQSRRERLPTRVPGHAAARAGVVLARRQRPHGQRHRPRAAPHEPAGVRGWRRHGGGRARGGRPARAAPAPQSRARRRGPAEPARRSPHDWQSRLRPLEHVHAARHPDGRAHAEGRAQLHGRGSHVREAAGRALVVHRHLQVEPALRQLRRPGRHRPGDRSCPIARSSSTTP